METKLTESLRWLSITRSRFIEKLEVVLPLQYLESSAGFHSSLIFTTLLVFWIVFAAIRSISLFIFHPLCMTIGTIIFIAEGLAVFRNRDLLDAFSPIMQKSKRTKVRTIHFGMHIVGACFIGLGMLFLVASKLENNQSLVPSTPHGAIGVVTLIWLVAQASAGQQKLHDLESKLQYGSKGKAWHGDAGLLVWDCICITVSLGCLELVDLSNSYLAVQVPLVASWLAVHLQMKRKGPETSQLSAFSSALLSSSTGGPDGSPAPFTEAEASPFLEDGNAVSGRQAAVNDDFAEEEPHTI